MLIFEGQGKKPANNCVAPATLLQLLHLHPSKGKAPHPPLQPTPRLLIFEGQGKKPANNCKGNCSICTHPRAKRRIPPFNPPHAGQAGLGD